MLYKRFNYKQVEIFHPLLNVKLLTACPKQNRPVFGGAAIF